MKQDRNHKQEAMQEEGFSGLQGCTGLHAEQLAKGPCSCLIYAWL